MPRKFCGVTNTRPRSEFHRRGLLQVNQNIMKKKTGVGRRLHIVAIMFAVACVGMFGQSRMPETKIAPREPELSEKDSLERAFEERPYFLLIDQSEKALEEGDYEAAALRLVEAMGVEPDNELNVALLSNLGMIYYYNEQDSLALVVLDKAIERAPRLIAPREGRARILVSNGRDKEAYREYENIMDIDSLNTEARFLHGMMALYGGDLATAKEDIGVLEKYMPTSLRTMVAQATMFSMTGCEREAVSLFRKIIEKDPAPEYFGRLTACLLALDNLSEASDVIGQWLEKYPNDAELYYYRAILNKKRYRPDEAQRDAKQAIRLGADPAHVSAIFN